MFVSQPHFLNGPYYETLIEGLKPDAALHDTYIDVEKVGYHDYVAFDQQSKCEYSWVLTFFIKPSFIMSSVCYHNLSDVLNYCSKQNSCEA